LLSLLLGCLHISPNPISPNPRVRVGIGVRVRVRVVVRITDGLRVGFRVRVTSCIMP